jgi:GAF domain-containing protein
VAQGALEVVRLGDDVIGRALAAGEIFLADDEGGGDRSALRLSACVPLVADGRVTGALALFRMREPKARLDEGDLELLRLLGAHGGTALLATRAVSERGLR